MLLLAALLAGPDQQTLPERAALYDCIDGFALSNLYGAASPVAIAVESLKSCNAERQALQRRLAKDRSKSAAAQGSLRDELDAEDRAASKRVIGVVSRNR